MGVEIVPAAIGYKDIVSYLCPSSKFPIKGGENMLVMSS